LAHTAYARANAEAFKQHLVTCSLVYCPALGRTSPNSQRLSSAAVTVSRCFTSESVRAAVATFSQPLAAIIYLGLPLLLMLCTCLPLRQQHLALSLPSSLLAFHALQLCLEAAQLLLVPVLLLLQLPLQSPHAGPVVAALLLQLLLVSGTCLLQPVLEDARALSIQHLQQQQSSRRCPNNVPVIMSRSLRCMCSTWQLQ
jgi:hypothetical protein